MIGHGVAIVTHSFVRLSGRPRAHPLAGASKETRTLTFCPIALHHRRVDRKGRDDRQQVDHVGPALPVLVPRAHQLNREGVAVGVVEDQDEAEVVTVVGSSV